MAVLYNRHRPSNFDSVIGQDHVTKILGEQIKQNRIGHAYLFTGPRGTGKTSVARIFAREVNGLNTRNSTDVIEIDAASNRGIDEVRELKAKIDFVPSSSKYKVYVIDEVHMLTKEAFNALLKTIEEPPSHVIFIMATTEPHKVPQTILSRVMRFDFRLGTREEIKLNLESVLANEDVKLASQAIDFVVRLARGSYRDSLSILEKVVSSRESKDIIELKEVTDILGYVDSEMVNSFINALENSDIENSLLILSDVQNSGKSVIQFGFQVIEELREILFRIINKKNSQSNLATVAKIIRELNVALKDSKTSLIDSLPFEIAVLEICGEEGDKISSIEKKPKLTIPLKKQEDKGTKEVKEIKEERKVDTQPKEKLKDDSKNKRESDNFDTIIANWGMLIERVKPFNHHLSAFLFKAKPVAIEEETLIIHVPFKLHKNKLESPASRKVMEKELMDLWGYSKYIINLDSQMLEEAKKSAIEPVSEVSNSDLVEDIFDV